MLIPSYIHRQTHTHTHEHIHTNVSKFEIRELKVVEHIFTFTTILQWSMFGDPMEEHAPFCNEFYLIINFSFMRKTPF